MKIGVYFTSPKTAGGVYQYSLSILEALSKIAGNKYTIFAVSKNTPDFIKKSRRFKLVGRPVAIHTVTSKFKNGISYLFTYLALRLLNYSSLVFLYKLAQKENIQTIEKQKLDLIIYPTSASLSFLASTPSVVAVHDLAHRFHPEFPEVSVWGRWENREFVFSNIAKKAFRILVDSEIGKEDLEGCYKESLGKAVVFPFLPPPYLNEKMSPEVARKICNSLGLPSEFIFYPANFWPHKNHRNLIKAIKILKKLGKTVNLVLTGSKNADFSSYNNVFSLIKKYGLEKQIFYLGYKTNNEVSAIYKLAKAMVMPTYFGPTNIPVLEAWKMGTPVIYSNIQGCREQLGDAGLLINPDKPRDIADKIIKIYTQPKLVKRLIKRGKKRLNLWTEKDFLRTIKKVINDYEKVRVRDGNN